MKIHKEDLVFNYIDLNSTYVLTFSLDKSVITIFISANKGLTTPLNSTRWKTSL